MQMNGLDCIACGSCTRSCVFLEKYGLNVGELAERPELFYSCFLCDRCREVCPVGISGKEIVLSGRIASAEGKKQSGKAFEKHAGKAERIPFSGYGGLLWEKDPYRFANYRALRSGSVLWTGCNFTGFFPKTEKRLRALFKEHGIGTVHDCCQKPVYELGLSDDADRNLEKIGQRLLDGGVKELIMVCPNCYYFMKERLPEQIRCVTVYRKLAELKLGKRISVEKQEGKAQDKPGAKAGREAVRFPLYLPCPDRTSQDFLRDLETFLPEETETETFAELQCCGLGGCASIRELGLSEELAKKAIQLSRRRASLKDINLDGAASDGVVSDSAASDSTLSEGTYDCGCLYTYCASCVGQFKRKGMYGAQHVLPLILGVKEEPSGGIRPLLNRVSGAVGMN